MSRSHQKHLTLWLLAALIFGCLSLAAGMNVYWDVRNYHFYNAYSFLHGRMDFDWGPAQQQTFHNPALEILPYLMMRHWPARLAGFLLGAVHGLNFALVAGLGLSLLQRMVPDLSAGRRWLLSLTAAAFGCYGPGFILELGSVSHDNVVSLFILAALWMAMVADDGTASRRLFIYHGLAGWLMGLAVGFKLNAAVYSLAFVAALLPLFPSGKLALRVLPLVGIAMLLGFLCADGWWMVVLYRKFGSPLFPYYNNVFRSEWLPAFFYGDVRWPPKTFSEAFSFPWRMASLNITGCEQVYRDGRYLIWMLTLLAVPVSLRAMRHPVGLENNPSPSSRGVRALLALLIFTLVGWVISLTLYGYMRYLVTLELLVPLLVLVLAVTWRKARVWTVPLVLLLLAANACWLRPPERERLDWQDRYFKVELPPLPTENTVVVMLSGEPMAYVIPYFNPAIRFVRPEGNILRGKMVDPYCKYQEAIWELVRQHRGALYAMMPTPPRAKNPWEYSWRDVGWKPDTSKSPLLVKTNIEQLALVPMVREAHGN